MPQEPFFFFFWSVANPVSMIFPGADELLGVDVDGAIIGSGC